MTRTLDLSVGGMLISPADSLAIADQVRFALDLGEITIAGDGPWCAATSDGARGILFDDLHGRAERALSHFVAQRQRELIASPPFRQTAAWIRSSGRLTFRNAVGSATSTSRTPSASTMSVARAVGSNAASPRQRRGV